MAPYYGYYGGGGSTSTAQVSTPTLVQHIASSTNPVGIGISGNNFKFQLPNAVGAGNCLILAVSFPNGQTATVTDNNGNSWPGSPTVSANNSGGNNAQIFVLPNVNAGQTVVEVSFGSAVIPFNYVLSEYYNVAAVSPTNGTTSAVAHAGASLAAGSFTPGNNNAGGGNLVWCYYAISGNASGNPSSWVPGSSFALLDADKAWTSNQGFPHATQAFVQATSTAINPGITATGDTQDYNCVAVALKAASAGTPPGSGIRAAKVIGQTCTVPPNSWVLQQPSVGNLRVLATASGPNILDITGIADSGGGTWNLISGSTGNIPQIWYSVNRTADPNFTMTLTIGGTPVNSTVLFYDVVGASASPFDASAVLGDTNADNLTSISNAPSITPTQSNGLVIAVMACAQGPGLAVTSPTGAVFNSVGYTGETDLDTIDNADCYMCYGNAGTSQINVGWTITSQSSNTIDAAAVALK